MALMSARTTSKTQIRSSLSRWEGSIDTSERPLFQAFVDETLNRLRGPFLAHHPPTAVLTYLEEAFQFARHRPPTQVSVSVRRRAKGVAAMVNMDDQPFIVDTVRLFLKARSAEYLGGFNLVFRATRNSDGELIGVGAEGGEHESLVMLEADEAAQPVDVEAASKVLELNLEHARAMVRDFKAMTRTVERFVDRCEVLGDRRPDQADAMRETASFLKWLMSENFVFMGVDAGAEPLGIQTIDSDYLHDASGSWPNPHAPGTVQVRKSPIESPVHRSGRIDELLVTVGPQEDPDSMQLFVRGMFTYRAVTQPSRNVPILRTVLAEILAEQTSAPGSFRYKGIANVFDSLPTEFLFTATRLAIAEMVDLVFEAEQQQDVGVTFIMNGQDSAFCLVAMPKRQFGDDLRRALEEEIVRTTSATYTDHGLFVGRYDTVLLHYYLTGVSFPGDDEVARLTEHIRKLATPWLARLWDALSEKFGESEADRLADTYGRAFPEEWMRQTGIERSVRDIELLEGLSQGGVRADMFEQGEELFLRVYQASNVHLTELLPVLSNFGITVFDAVGTLVKSRGGMLHVDTFRLVGDRASLLEGAPLLTEAIRRVFDGSASDDRLNCLVLTAGLSWEQVDLLRCYARYCQQLQFKLSAPRMTEILLNNPQIVRSIIALFEARFDPDLPVGRGGAVDTANEVLHDKIRLIRAHDEDLAFSSLQELVLGTVRTNYYRTDRPHHYLSIKLAGDQVQAMGKHPPRYEIYVHARDVEGVHLRFGLVARGGLRWSDRDDYRTEVLGLVTTQQVKNVVIVPTGSKGGFYLKRAPRDRAERRKMADEQYQTFIRGLLDLTDNREGNEVVEPPRVVRHDGDDPYLVVAADKGTAHLSDTANRISESYGFWLGDAFASGGSNGYDHKKVGITARGAWVLVRRHFAEREIDPYTTPFTAVGIGDMGGDVFGNGMLESPSTRLLAAFNHLHVFLDPDPDPAVSYGERKRLFACQGGWDQYDTSLISEGGGVFERRSKQVELTSQTQEMLGLSGEFATPEDVINAILKMEVDLLWNGGIGTYVKATTETHADADDRSNDDVRIDASELRARIVGEGGNLGLTQTARIEAALLGVRLNTDAIDNSAGVDMSDHEVNLKILLDGVVASGSMKVASRNALLEQMTEEVATLVLADNDMNGRQLSRDALRAAANPYSFGRAIDFVERYFGRERDTLGLPSDEELARRADAGSGLTRPELAVLSAWVKMFVSRELMSGGAKELPGYRDLLHQYFPKAIRSNYADAIDAHMLADEIVVAVATNRMVSDAGAAFFPMMIEASGSSVTTIAQAYLKAQRLARSEGVRGTLEELRTSVSLQSLNRAWIEVDMGAREVALYWLSTGGSVPDDEMVEEMKNAAQQVYELQATDVVARNREQFEELLAEDIPEEVARRILRAQYLNIALTVWSEAKRSKEPFEVIAVRHLAIGRASRLQEVLDDLARRPAEGRWDPIALNILHARFHTLLRRLVSRCPVERSLSTVDQLEPSLARGALSDVRAQVDDLIGEDERPTTATLLVLEERVASAMARISS
ncbi:MAG: NAD-glutamate dehydrogenase [Myxococcales bacterium]|nr:NAD-glutamate dehydrogenase [Myxococcales bacterium]